LNRLFALSQIYLDFTRGMMKITSLVIVIPRTESRIKWGSR